MTALANHGWVTNPLGERRESGHGQLDSVGKIFGRLTFIDACDDELSELSHLPARIYLGTSSANWTAKTAAHHFDS